MKTLKHAQVSIQFNWIFVLIAGAIILLFFAGLVIRQKGVSETRFCGAVLNNLDATFSLVAESSGTQKSTDMANMIIDFDCREYRCRDSENIPAKPFGKTPVFSPSTLDGRFLEVSSKEWSVPFRVTNFLFTTNKEMRYYLVYDSESESFARYIEDELPDNITKELISVTAISSLADENDNAVRFVFFDVGGNVNLPTFFEKYADRVTALEIRPANKLIKFYEASGSYFTSQGEANYVNNIDLQAAIFSDNYDNFICGIRKAYERLDYMATLNYFRTGYLKADADQNTLCPFTLEKAEAELNGLSLAALDCLENVDFNCVTDISSRVSSLMELNNILIREGCPLIY